MAGLLIPTRNGSSSTPPALRATVKITSDGTRAITRASGEDYVIIPEVVIGDPADGDPCLLVFDELARPWLIANGAASGGVTGPGASYETTFGDGVAKTFTITHNLGSRSVHVSVYLTDSPYTDYVVDFDRTTVDTITLRTNPALPAPALGQFTVVVSKVG